MQQVGQFQVFDLSDAYKSSEMPTTREEHEFNYRRGYRDGYLAAINDLELAWFLKKRNRIADALWDHAMNALTEWQMSGGGGFVLPPDVPRLTLCAYCGAVGEHMDHILPRSRGGSDNDENLTPSCARCNGAKRDMTPEEWMGG